MECKYRNCKNKVTEGRLDKVYCRGTCQCHVENEEIYNDMLHNTKAFYNISKV